MKSIREFFFLSRKIGIHYAMLYLAYKIHLKILNSDFHKKIFSNLKVWLKKIMQNMFLFEHVNDVDLIQGREYVKINHYVKDEIVAYLRPFSSDEDVFHQIIDNLDYLPVVNIYNALFPSEPKNIIDCGANIGLTSLFFSQYYQQSSILAIEPFEDNIKTMDINFTRNNITNCKILHGGVWNRNTPLYVETNFRDGKEWSVTVSENKIGNKTIPGYSLCDIISSLEEVDILKIDIEGSEKQLFADPNYAKIFLSKTKCIAIEIHDEFDCRADILGILSENRFFFFDSKDTTIAVNLNYLINTKVNA